MATPSPLYRTGLCASAATDTRQYIHYSDSEGVVKEIRANGDKVAVFGVHRILGVKLFSSLASFHWLTSSNSFDVGVSPRSLSAVISVILC